MRTDRNCKVALLIAGAVTLVGRPGHAYNGATHHGVVSLGWEVMRAASDPQFGNNVNWKPVPPALVGVPPAPLSTFGACELCGPNPTVDAWNRFTAKIPTSLVRLNSLNPGLSVMPCTGTLTGDGTLGGMVRALGTAPSLGDPAADCTGKFIGTALQGGAYNFDWHPGGIFDFTHPNAAIDTSRYQGLLLGWHAKTGDDHLNDTVLESLWLNRAFVAGLIIAALVAIGIVVALGGGLLLLAGAAVVVIAIVVLALLFCLAGIFDGDGCGNGVANGFSHLIEAAHSPATALDRHFPEIDAIIPRGGDVKSSKYTGMWHYVDARSGGSSSYDDRQGLNYDESGPTFEASQADTLIQGLLDLGDLHIGFDESDGPHHYEVVGANDGHPDSSRRGFFFWQGPTAAHIPFEPLDNFGFYGWSNFLTTHDAHWLSWPLHALGDATVPMHVTDTSGWGHRPYENALDWSGKWHVIRFMKCTPDAGGDCAQQCFVDPNDPTKTCDEKNAVVTSDGIGVNENYREQWEQARRILQHAFRWTRFIEAWRARVGQPQGLPVRDMVTQLALETLSLSNQNGGDNSWPWCDDCSMDEAMPGILGGGDHNQGKDFYFTDDSLGKSRVLVERSVGATIAFLMATADVLPAPTCSTTACPNGVSCCSGQSCSNGVCCKPTLGACQHDADCCGGPATSVCRNGSCAPRAAGICQQEGQSCEDGPAACCADSAGARQCGRSANGVNVCCGGSGTTCRSSVECCDGFCDITAGSIGVCRKLPLGAGCTASAQCQDGALCESNGAPPTISRPQGTCCNPSSTGTLDCTTDADCCTGVCGSIGNDQFKCMCAAQGVVCSSDLDCCAGNACTGGTCQPVCRVDNTPCQDNSQCCGSSVCCGGVTGGPVCKAVCGCLPHGGFCQTDSDCCAPNSCQNGRCLEACGHAGASCQSGAECCSGGCGDSICECEATGTTCVETADCCVGNLCCAGVGGAPNVCRTSCCQADGASCQNNNDCCGGSVCCANLGFTCTAVCPVVK